jgi:hypothetical protein
MIAQQPSGNPNQPIPQNPQTQQPIGPTNHSPAPQGREADIVGGLINALERGDSLEKAKRSFLNAGYRPEEVEAAAKNSASFNAQPPVEATPASKSVAKVKAKPLVAVKPIAATTSSAPTAVAAPKKFSKIWIISLVIISAMILIGAAIFGLYWSKIFS